MVNSPCFMRVTMIFVIGLLFRESSALNYLDNYFCMNEICNQHYQDCSVVPLPATSLVYCNAKTSFINCVQAIPLVQSATLLSAAYDTCRSVTTYANSGQFFYYLNCQINCGYQELWVSCGQQLQEIGNCSSANCPSGIDYTQWDTAYQNCITTVTPETCPFIYFGGKNIALEDCTNSIKARCKFQAAEQLGPSNTFVNLLYCSHALTIFTASLLVFIAFFF